MFNYYGISQTSFVLIKGIVNSDPDNERIENALVHLKVSDGGMFEAKTNNQGEYSFQLKNDTTLRFFLSVVTTIETKSKNSKNYRFLNIVDTKIPEKIEAGKDYIKDFKLPIISHQGMSFPKIIFKENSTKPNNNFLNTLNSKEYDTFENSIDFIYEILQSNPTIIIEISGHASAREQNPEKLSSQRAKYVKEILVTKGINMNRIYTEGLGNRKLLITDQMIDEAKKAKTKEEKKALHLKNQRVVFRIISWDFKE